MLYKLQQYYLLLRLNTVNRVGLLLIPTLISLELNRYIYNIKFTTTIAMYYIVFVVGAVLMRSFGCIINDYFDKNLDKQVARTKTRPLALGSVTTAQAFILLVIIGLISLWLLLKLPKSAIVVGLLSLVVVVVYPLSKRFFYIPQLILGLAFNWGVLVSAVLFSHYINALSWWLFVAFVVNTVIYDTIYAYQDYADDVKLNVYSFTKILKNNFKPLFVALYVVIFAILVYIAFSVGINYKYIFALGIATMYMIYLLIILNVNNLQMCYNFFKANVGYQFVIFGIFFIHNLQLIG